MRYTKPSMKKKSFISVVTVLAILIIVSSAIIYEYGVAGTHLGCRLLGGDWTRILYSGKSHCLLPAKDAGKDCTDSDQCQGACIGRDDLRRGDPARGTCSKYSEAMGCFTSIEDGKVDLSICVD